MTYDSKRHLYSFIKTRNPAILLKYKKLSNSIRNLQKKEQSNIAYQCKTNPKKFWNYVNSKFKNKNNIGNLDFINSLGKEEITSNDTTKTEIFNSFFSTIFVKEENTNFTPLENVSIVIPMENLVINELDIIKRLDKLDINKAPGPKNFIWSKTWNCRWTKSNFQLFTPKSYSSCRLESR